eukprot:c4676_g1_i1.p1 GENE.c4676_g1_i1~~c4676_g1_i1.p1  ORF type:complete len:440 (-),score=104.12 c4676_g1_i1:114-1433(-)
MGIRSKCFFVLCMIAIGHAHQMLATINAFSPPPNVLPLSSSSETVKLFSHMLRHLLRVASGKTQMLESSFAIQSMATVKDSSLLSVGTCRFRTFPSADFSNNAVLVPADSATTEATCQRACTNASKCFGYQFTQANNMCKVVTGYADDVAFNSGLCLVRGGCDGTKGNNTCIWKHLSSMNILPAFQNAPSMTPLNTRYESQCRTTCEANTLCLGYVWAKQAANGIASGTCSFLGSPAFVSGSSSGLCSRALTFDMDPRGCNINKPCYVQPVVSVPQGYGSVAVHLDVQSAISAQETAGQHISGPLLTGRITRAVNNTATFTSFTVGTAGTYSFVASAAGVDCPAVSFPVVVSDPDLLTLFRFQEGFPSLPFLLVRLKHDCTFVTFFMVIAFLVDLSLVSSLFAKSRVTKIIAFVFLAVTGMFTWDFVQAFNKWGCSAEF